MHDKIPAFRSFPHPQSLCSAPSVPLSQRERDVVQLGTWVTVKPFSLREKGWDEGVCVTI